MLTLKVFSSKRKSSSTLCAGLGEAALHDVLDAELLDAQQVQDHAVRQVELRHQLRWSACADRQW